MRPYANRKAIQGLSCTNLSYFGHWGSIPQIMGRERYIKSHGKCWTQHFTSNVALLKCKGDRRVALLPVLAYLEDWGNMGNTGPNTVNNGEGYTKIDPMCSVPHFSTIEVLRKGKDHLRVEFYLS